MRFRWPCVPLLQLAMLVALPSLARGQTPVIDRVFIITLENAEFTDIVGNSAAPYLNSLIARYGLATNYNAVQHPSLPNYMALTGGDTFFSVDCDDCRVDAPNIADLVEAVGRSWMAYMDGMSGPCGLVSAGTYAVSHNPFVHYTDIAGNASRCAAHVQPFTRFAADLSGGLLANYVWITPDRCHDMHDCGVGAGDAWLQTVVPSIVQAPAFTNAILFIVWDEGNTNLGGGGRVPLLVISPGTPAGSQSGIAANHYSLLRTVEDAWGLSSLGQSATARSITEFSNLLQRPGFEEYQPPSLGPPGWVSDAGRQTASFSETHQPRSGSRNGACWTPGFLDCGMYQTIVSPWTGSFTLNVYANADRPGGLVGANVNGALAASASVQARGFGNYGAPYTMTFNASAGDRIVVWMYSPAAPGYVVIDDVSLVGVGTAGTAPPPPTSSLDWVSQDVGNIGLAGTTTTSGGIWTVAGAGGAAIWGTADAFRFVYQPLSGDGQITARVDSLQNTTAFAKAGIMLRDGLSAGAPNVVLDIRPTGDVEFMQRSVSGGATTFYATARAPAPSWVRLTRTGSTIVGSISSDGVIWVVIGATTANMSTSVNAGIVVTSNDSNQLNSARFEGLSLTPAPWIDQDVGAVGLTGGATSNGAEFSVMGAGASGIWGAADAFHFVYRTLSGDGQIVARIVSQQNTSAFAKVGIMMRDGIAPGAPNVVLDIRPTSAVEFMQRTVAGGPTTFYATALAPPPYWLRLVRSGSTVTAAVSPDGNTWSTIGSTAAAMSQTIQIGVVVTSVNGGQLNTAKLDGVTVR